MIKQVENIKATCTVCGEHVDGRHEIKGRYYCAGHYNEYYDSRTDKQKEKSRIQYLRALDLEKL